MLDLIAHLRILNKDSYVERVVVGTNRYRNPRHYIRNVQDTACRARVILDYSDIKLQL